MTLWILFALMTGLAALTVLVPLRRSVTADAAVDAAADEAVYKAQLEEVERDLQRGLVDAAQAEAARTEIARRLLNAHRQNQGRSGLSATGSAARAALLPALILPAGALGLYLWLGSPGVPDQPLEARLQSSTEGQSVEILVARVERHLADNPQDGQGWEVLAPVYMSLGRPEDAAQAYANSIRLNGATEAREAAYGEALVVAAKGLITADARAAFERAVKLDPAAPKARFFLALGLGQEGRREEAIAAWKQLLEGAPENEAWVPAARQELAQLQGLGVPAQQAGRGPGAADVEAAAAMSETDRNDMIRSMVEGLRSRLETDGGPAEEWVKLVRAQVVLGQRDAAKESLAKARAAHAGDAGALEALLQAETEFGLGS